MVVISFVVARLAGPIGVWLGYRNAWRSIMKQLGVAKGVALILAWCLAPLAWSASAPVVEIEVRGLTCPFCVYGLSKNLGKAPGVVKADVDLEVGRARLELAPGQAPDIEQYKKIIKDAGFTPGNARVQNEEAKP